jgi:hypothetical protein
LSAIVIDQSQLPLVLVKWDGPQTDADLDAYIASFEAIHRLKRPFATISWMKRYSSNRAHTRRLAEWMKQCDQATRDYCVCTAMIAESMGFRFILSSVFLIKPLSIPYQVVATFDEAATYVRDECGKRGLELPRTIKPFA